MLKIELATGMVISEDLKASIKAIDSALLQETRLTSSLIEASDQIGLPINHSQKLLEGMARGFEKLVSSRSDMLAVVRQVNAIRAQSTLEVVDLGCPVGLTLKEPMKVGDREDAPVPAMAG
jgi:hypothetical protein